MRTEMIDERDFGLSDNAAYVGSAWLMAAVVVTFLMTVVAPFLSA